MQQRLIEQLDSLDPRDLRQVLAHIETALATRHRPTGPVTGKPCPARAFYVPEQIKFLDSGQLESLSRAFDDWRDKAANGTQLRSRQRVWLVYQFIRHGGLKLGEVLRLDLARDVDFDRSQVLVRDEPPREVLVPQRVLREVRRLVEDPASGLGPDATLGLDPGFVRKKFYERGAEAGLPSDMAAPSVIRHSYAVELLRNGVPLLVVQSVLGHQSLALTANYMGFSDADASRVIQHYFERRAKMKTSARNMFTGKVTAVRQGMILSEVEMATPSGLKVVSVITNDSLSGLGLAEGTPVTATVKAPWVVLVKEEQKLLTSARNKFCGKIVKINEGQIAAEVIVELADGTKVCSLVTDESVKDLDLKVGEDICALFKAFSVVLNVV